MPRTARRTSKDPPWGGPWAITFLCAHLGENTERCLQKHNCLSASSKQNVSWGHLHNREKSRKKTCSDLVYLNADGASSLQPSQTHPHRLTHIQAQGVPVPVSHEVGVPGARCSSRRALPSLMGSVLAAHPLVGKASCRDGRKKRNIYMNVGRRRETRVYTMQYV